MPTPHQNLDPLATIAQAIYAGLSTGNLVVDARKAKPSQAAAVYKILRDVLTSQGREVRLQLMQHLLAIESAQAGGALPANTVFQQADDLIGTEDAAKLLGVSRPYVAMLIDQGQIQGATKTVGGHRRIARAAVLAWKSQHQGAVLAKSERLAVLRLQGMDDDIYATPEKQVLSRIKRLRAGRAAPAKVQAASKSKFKSNAGAA